MNYGKKYLENQIMTSSPVALTLLVYDDILDKITYIKENLDKNDVESFGSEQSLKKLDRMERLVEEMHMGIASLTEKPFLVIAQNYQAIIEAIHQFKGSYDMKLLDGISILVTGLKESYEGVVKRERGY